MVRFGRRVLGGAYEDAATTGKAGQVNAGQHPTFPGDGAVENGGAAADGPGGSGRGGRGMASG